MSGLPCPQCNETIEAPENEMPRACPTCNGSLQICNRFQLVGLLGQRGNSWVYDARRQPGGEAAAVKVVALGEEADWKTTQLFERSARAQQGLRHEQLAAVHDYDKDDHGNLYLVRERLDGGTLHERLVAGQCLDSGLYRQLLESLLEAIVYLHGRMPPVIHGNIKPTNVMFRSAEDWQPVLVDCDTLGGTRLASTDATSGAASRYAAPEQRDGNAVAASDLYALGLTLVFAATQVEPEHLPQRDGRFDVAPLMQGIEPRIRTTVLKLTEPSPGKRYLRAQEALADLRRGGVAVASGLEEGRPEPKPQAPPAEEAAQPMPAPAPRAPSVAAPQPVRYQVVPSDGAWQQRAHPQPKGKSPAAVLAVALVIALLGAGGAFVFLLSGEGEERAPTQPSAVSKEPPPVRAVAKEPPAAAPIVVTPRPTAAPPPKVAPSPPPTVAPSPSPPAAPPPTAVSSPPPTVAPSPSPTAVPSPAPTAAPTSPPGLQGTAQPEPGSPEAAARARKLVKQGMRLYKQKQYQEAIKTMEAALAIDPQNRLATRYLELIKRLVELEREKSKAQDPFAGERPGRLQIRKAVQPRVAAVSKCLRLQVTDKRRVFQVRFRVEPSGQLMVESVDPASSEGLACLRETFAGVSFKPFAGKPLTFVYPFVIR